MLKSEQRIRESALCVAASDHPAGALRKSDGGCEQTDRSYLEKKDVMGV